MTAHSPVDTIANAPAIGRAIVAAVHIPADHVIYVACSRHGVLLTDAYGAEARRAEIHLAERHANLRGRAHAVGCTAKRLRKSATDATSGVPK